MLRLQRRAQSLPLHLEKPEGVFVQVQPAAENVLCQQRDAAGKTFGARSARMQHCYAFIIVLCADAFKDWMQVNLKFINECHTSSGHLLISVMHLVYIY